VSKAKLLQGKKIRYLWRTAYWKFSGPKL